MSYTRTAPTLSCNGNNYYMDSVAPATELNKPANTAFDIRSAIGGVVQGGSADLSWTVVDGGFPIQGTKSSGYHFDVKGTNPTPEAVKTYLASQGAFWYAPYIFKHESQLVHQFNLASETPAEEPSWGYPCGFGIGQIDPPPNPSVVWNWQANVTAAVSKMIAFESTARTLWSQSVAAYNRSGVNLPLCPLVVSNGSGQVVEYRLTVPITQPPTVGSAKPWVRPYSDGSALKFNAGYGDGPYMRWNNLTSTWDYLPWSHDSKPKNLPPGTPMPPLYAHEYPVEFFREEP